MIDEGRVRAEGSPQQLIDWYGGGACVRFTADSAGLSWLSEVTGVTEVTRDRGRYVVLGDGPVLAYVAAGLVSRGLAPTHSGSLSVRGVDADTFSGHLEMDR